MNRDDRIREDLIDRIAKNAEKTYDQSKARIEEIAQSVDAVKLFVSLFTLLVPGPVEDVNELTHGGIPAKMELFAFHVFPYFGASGETDLTPWHINECIKGLNKLFTSRFQHRLFSRPEEKQTTDADAFSQLIRAHAEIVGGSAYPEQTKEEIISIQGRFESWFTQRLGLGPKRAIELLCAIVKAEEVKINSFLNKAVAHGNALKQFWIGAKSKSRSQRNKQEKEILTSCKDKKDAWYFGFIEYIIKIAADSIPVQRTDLVSLENPPTETEWNSLIKLIGLTKQICNSPSLTVDL